MRQVWITRTGGPEVLELREAPDPVPGKGEVLIRVEASGINFSDLMARQGLYRDAPELPAVMGYEVGGTVEAIGEGVTKVKEGDPVMALPRFGGYASHVVTREIQVFARPDNMGAATAAAIPVNYLTAFQALVVMGGLRHAHDLGGRRMRVLIHGAAGGVGTAAGDLGKIYGAQMFGTASDGKHDYVRERGYSHAIAYQNHDWAQEVMDLTDGRGVDIVLDPIGGRHWSKSIDVLAPGGRLVLYGYSSILGTRKLGLAREIVRIPWRRFSPFSLMNANRGVLGVNLGHLWEVADDVERWAEKLLDYYRRGDIRPHVDRKFPLEEAAEAHAYIEARKNTGKVLLIP